MLLAVESLLTEITLMRFLIAMGQFMHLQTAFAVADLSTGGALEGLISEMKTLMVVPDFWTDKALCTEAALVSDALVFALASLHHTHLNEAFLAVLTFVGFLSRMSAFVGLLVGQVHEGFLAEVTLVSSFSFVSFHVSFLQFQTRK